MTPPLATCLLACREVRRDPQTRRCDVLGVVHVLNLGLPAVIDLAVYYALTGCHGPADLMIEVLDPEDAVIASGPSHVPVTDPLDIVEGEGAFGGVTLDRAGPYRVRISCGGEVLAERRVEVGEG